MKHVLMHEIDSTECDGPDRKITIVVHFDSPDGTDFTLCGAASEEDDRYPETMTPTTRRVDCERCLGIRDHVLGRR